MTPRPSPCSADLPGGAGDDIPVSTWSGTFNIGPVEIRCHVLSDGRRIVEAESVEAFCQWLLSGSDTPVNQGALAEFQTWYMRATPPATGRETGE